MKLYLSIFILLLYSHASAQQTALDSTFGHNGIVLVDSPAQMQNNKVALQADGRIVLAGTYYYYLLPSFDLVYEMRIMRFMPDGRPDSTFNGNGLFTKYTDRSTRLAALNIQPDGKILVTGSTNFLERYLPDGTPDSSFNDSGRVVIHIFTPYDYLGGTAVAPDGKIITTGTRAQSVQLVARFKPDGRPDSTFGYLGEVTTTLDSTQGLSGTAVVIQPDGKILVAGGDLAISPVTSRFSVIRYQDDGYLDPTFNNGKGYVRFSFSGSQYGGGAGNIGLQPNGKIVVGGAVYFPPTGSPYLIKNCIARITSSGIIDSTFGTNGRIVSDTLDSNHPYNAPLSRVRLQPDGKILLGITENSIPDNRKFALRRFTADGAVDGNFGLNGKVTTDITANQDMPFDIAMQGDGKILVAGVSDVDDHWPSTLHSLPTLVRYLPNVKLGAPIPAHIIQGLQAYPNPATSSLTLRYSLTEAADVAVMMTDVYGRVVQQWAIDSQRSNGTCTERLEFNKAIAPGVYLLTVVCRGERQTLRILKE